MAFLIQQQLVRLFFARRLPSALQLHYSEFQNSSQIGVIITDFDGVNFPRSDQDKISRRAREAATRFSPNFSKKISTTSSSSSTRLLSTIPSPQLGC